MRDPSDSSAVRWTFGVLGSLMVLGIVGTVAMYGQVGQLEERTEAQERHIESLDQRVQQCENIVRRRDQMASKQ
jgi:hypothetical protein